VPNTRVRSRRRGLYSHIYYICIYIDMRWFWRWTCSLRKNIYFGHTSTFAPYCVKPRSREIEVRLRNFIIISVCGRAGTSMKSKRKGWRDSARRRITFHTKKKHCTHARTLARGHNIRNVFGVSNCVLFF